METKVCKRCNIEKEINDFYKNGKNYNSVCKECKKIEALQYAKKNKEKIKEYQTNYRIKNKDDLKKYYKKHYIENSEKIKNYHKEYYANNIEKIKDYLKENKEKIKEKRKTYYEKNFQQINTKHKEWLRNNKKEQLKYEKDRFHNDKIFKLKKQSRNLIRSSFSRKGQRKKYKGEEIIGCSIENFIKHLLKSFKKNYGYEWDGKEKVHIDHIIPLFEAKKEEDVIKLCHYTNLQLLKAKDNLQKSNKKVFKVKEDLYESK